MTRPQMAATPVGSSLQRRLEVVASSPDRPWIMLAENIPEWPPGLDPMHGFTVDPSASYGYTAARGTGDLRAAIADREQEASGHAVSLGNILVTAGAMQAIGLVLRHLAASGYRKVIYPHVTFVGVHDTLHASGLDAVAARLTGEPEDWKEIRRHATDSCVVYLNLPHNPTGAVLTPRYVEAMRVFMAERPCVVVLLDAVYDAFVFDEAAAAPMDLAVTTDNLVVVNSVSKNYGRPGDRVGWATASERLVNSLAARLEWESICVSPGQQALAATAIRAGNDALVAAVQAGRQAIEHLAASCSWLDGLCLPPGGTHVTVPLPVDDLEGFAEYALVTHQLVLTTSSNYAPEPAAFVRLPTGVPASRLEAGFAALGRALSGWTAARSCPSSLSVAVRLGASPRTSLSAGRPVGGQLPRMTETHEDRLSRSEHMQPEKESAHTTIPRAIPGRGASRRLRRGEDVRRVLRARVMGAPSAVEVDPSGVADSVRWWTSQQWLPRELVGPLEQLDRASRRLVENRDAALAFELSRMAVSLGGPLGDALVHASAPPARPDGRPHVLGCPDCGADGLGCFWSEEGLVFTELCCSECQVRAVVSWPASSGSPRVSVDRRGRTVAVDSSVVPVSVRRHNEGVVVAAALRQTLAPVVLSILDGSW